jgi:pimeloyl-ACP methyl ester carboxylesterase
MRRRPLALAASAAAGAGAAWLYCRYRRDIAAAHARVAAGSRVAQTRCGPIEYAVRGDGAPVLVVHGAGGGYDQGLDVGEPLVPRGFRIVPMSRFGYLRTPLPVDASAAAQADAHACLLDALGIERAAVIGASAGAPSALQFALRHPARCTALVLLVPAAYVPRAHGAASVVSPRATRMLFDTVLRSDFLFWLAPRIARRAVIRGLLATPPSLVARASAAERQRVARMIEHILPVTPRRRGLVNDARVTTTLGRYDLEHVRVPTLAIGVEDDLFGTWDAARYTAQHVPDARFLSFAAGGHVCVGVQARVLDAIANFLRAHPDGRAAVAARETVPMP